MVCFFAIALAAAPIEIGGFIDWRYVAAEDRNDEFQFRPGNGVEVAIGSQITERFHVDATFVSAGGQFALGPSFLDYHFLPDGEHHPRGWYGHSGIQAGLFDIPFGTDWRYFSSVDRPSISAPFLTDRLLAAGWTDVGAQIHYDNKGFSANIYGANGLQWDNGTDAVFLTGDDNALTVPLTAFSNGKTYGGRFGYKFPFNLEFGGSYAKGDYRAGVEADMTLAGGDFTFERGPLTVRGEYVRFNGENPGARDINIRTSYVEATYALGEKWLPFIRHDRMDFDYDRNADGAVNDDFYAWLVGVKREITENVAWRAEYQSFRYDRNVTDRENAFRSSLVAAF